MRGVKEGGGVIVMFVSQFTRYTHTALNTFADHDTTRYQRTYSKKRGKVTRKPETGINIPLQ